jgi:triacylglycerol lipase
LSGVYNVDESSTHPGVRAYFGDDYSLYRDRSPVNFITNRAVPVELAIAEYDLPFVVASGFNLALALTLRDNKSPPLVWMRGHNHVSSVLALGTPEDQLAEAMVGAFDESLRQRPGAS